MTGGRPSFNPCFGGLVGQVWARRSRITYTPGFNPCFGGLVGQVAVVSDLGFALRRFNPCFGGLVGQVMKEKHERVRGD